MKGKTVAILESRMRDHIASLVRKYGGTPFSAPALAEIPDVDPAHIDELIRHWNSGPPDIFIFQTGVGTRALFAATDWHCHAASGLRSRWRFGSQGDEENQLPRLPLSARDHPAGDLALSPVHTEPT